MLPFESSVAHVLAECARIDLLLRGALDRLDPQIQQPGRGGVLLRRSDIDRLFGRPLGQPVWLSGDEPWSPEEVSAQARVHIQLAAKKSTQSGIELRLDELCARAGLSARERDALLCALLPEVDSRYCSVFGYLHDDLTRERPSASLLADLLAPSPSARAAMLRELHPSGRLAQCGLIRNSAVGPDSMRPFIARSVQLEPAVVDFLLEFRADVELPDGAEIVEGHGLLLDLEHPWLQGAGRGRLLTLEAEEHSSVDVWRSLATSLGRPVIVLGKAVCRQLSETPGSTRDICRLQLLTDMLVGWEPVESAHAWAQAAAAYVARWTTIGLQVWLADRRSVLPRWPVADLAHVSLSRPTVGSRAEAWRRLADRLGLDLADHVARELAQRHPFAAIGTYLRSARATGISSSGPVTAADIDAAVHRLAPPRLGRFAVLVEQTPPLAALVLADGHRQHLEDVANAFAARRRVAAAWTSPQGSRPPGSHALFVGPPGTGKTTAAAALATAIGRPLYLVDLSQVVSKYIGETEKHLEEAFAQAEQRDVLLLFDEADALFAKRSTVTDARDRYANMETSYLLQRIEQFDGRLIMATNRPRDLDRAFMRRVTFVVRFPEPTAEHRRQIWAHVWPKGVEFDRDIEFDPFARHFSLTGGHIRNIVFAASLVAGAYGRPVGAVDLVRATQRELAKLGRSCTPDDFGPYAEHFLREEVEP